MDGKLLAAACLTGFFGDAGLQILTKKFNLGGPSGWGLNPYFALHGSAEALFIAAGMMTLFYVLYLAVFPANWIYLVVYGILLDLLFRKTMLFSSLTGYYSHLNYFWSGFWGAVPMLIPFIVASILG
jgi:hypothetical protein